MEQKNRRRALRGASALVAGALVALGFSAAASAATPSTIEQSTGELIIHKYEQPAESLNLKNDGTEVTVPASAKPLAGAEFTIQQLVTPKYDLSTNAGWDALGALGGDISKVTSSELSTTKIAPITTGADGIADFAGIPVGAYLVTETLAPMGATAVAPFLVTVPITNPADPTGWLYTVNVYPKDSMVNMPTKTVNDANATKIGDNVTWTILGDIPTPKDTDGSALPIDGYGVKDVLDMRLKYGSVVVSTTGSAGTTLTAGTDYTVTAEPATKADTDNTTSQTVMVKLTASGLTKIAAAKAADATAQVKVALTTLVSGNGAIPNSAMVYPNAASFDIQPGEPGGPVPTDPENPAITKFGNVTIAKVDAGNSDPVAGAVFSIYASQSDAESQTSPIALAGNTTFTTDASGLATFTGLHQSGWYNGAAVDSTDANYKYYWIVEVQAPSGYELLSKPVQVAVGDDNTTVDYTVKDSKPNGGFQLPFTGSALGAGLFYGGGAAVLLAIAAILVARSRRKSVEI